MMIGIQEESPNYETVKDSPQPQASFMFGFLNANLEL